MAADAGKAQASTRFKPGQSGNPAGGKVGRKPATLLRELLKPEHAALATEVIDAALKQGNVKVALFIAERVHPPAKINRLDGIELPDTSTPAGVIAAQAELVRLVTSGQILPDQAEVLSTMLANTQSAQQVAEMSARVAELTARYGK